VLVPLVGTLTANTVTGVMITFMDNEKYNRRKTTIMHIFLFNLILFFLTIPLYLLGTILDITLGIAAVHFLLSAFITALIMEVLAGYQYSLLGIYSTALGMFASIAIALLMLAGGSKPIVIMFAAMPGVWLILQVIGGISELIYDNFVRLYGIEALDMGFHQDTAMQLKSEEWMFKKIDIKDYVKQSRVLAVKGRTIGRGGKAKLVLERLTNCEIEIKGHYIGIIGKAADVTLAMGAIVKLVQGSPHSKVYAFLDIATARIEQKAVTI